MKNLALVACLIFLGGCADVSPNYNAFLEAQKQHDIQQANQTSNAITAIRSTTPTRGFSTPAESAMFAVIQSMLIADVQYIPLNIQAPMTGYDYLSRATGPLLAAVNPWLLWWAADSGSSESKNGNAIYNVEGGGDLLVNSANAGSQNSGSVVQANGYTSNFKTESVCLTGECDENGNVVNPVDVIGGYPPPDYVCSPGEMVTPTCSCATRQAGGC